MLLLEVAAAIEGSALSEHLRASTWTYPLINAGHVVGIALLFGSIVPLDLRLLGRQADAPLDLLARVLVPVAVAGLLLAIVSGVLLFVTRPRDYVVEPLFGIKLALLAAGIANALLLHRSARWRRLGEAPRAPVGLHWKCAALLSMLVWLGVIVAGRLIGYR